jgi:hypothetical protein
MSDDHGRDAAAEAFTGLRASVERQGEEIVLLRRAIEGMAAARAETPELPELPDYSETLAKQLQGIAIVMREVAALQKLPALDMTPEQMAARITAAGASARSDDRALIAEARRALDDISRSLNGHIKEARGVAAQKRALIQVGLGGLAAGALLWSVLPGFVARNVAPASWHWPERMATRTLSADGMWNGARRLGAVASPANWDTMVEGAIVVQDNRDAVDGCRKAMGKNARSTKCTITLSRLDAPAAGNRQDQAAREKAR